MRKKSKRRDRNRAYKIYFAAIFVSMLLIFALFGVINSTKSSIITTNIDKNSSQIASKKTAPEISPTKQMPKFSQKQRKKDENLSILFEAIDKNLALQKQKLYKSQSNQSAEFSLKPHFAEKNTTKISPFSQNLAPKIEIPPLKKAPKKPLLAIIIDDVGHFHQAKAIKQTGLKLTPSIFPVSKNNPHSAQIAKDFEVFMIHLPLSATHYKNEEPKTLHPNDSFDKIFARLKQIKADFPRLKFINNHTGSEFTSNFSASQNLIKAIKMQNLIFLDSKTTPKSAILAACKKHKFPYISRDIFLDNVLSQSAILSQLKQAINIAKRRGYAIAIGHPHDITLKTLSQSTMLQDVEIVYIDRIYKEIYGNFN